MAPRRHIIRRERSRSEQSVAMEFELGPGLPGWEDSGGKLSCNGVGCLREPAVLLPVELPSAQAPASSPDQRPGASTKP
jgi:hypothetical protein